MNFWKELSQPVFALAPMEDVTDTVFRELVMSVSSPEVLKVVFTEFTSTDGLLHKKGAERVGERLLVSDAERSLLSKFNIKLVAQIWGNDPEKFARTAELLTRSGQFDGIDINMGCPVKKVVLKNTCSALIKSPALAKEIIEATRSVTHLPVSVKTRIGFNRAETEEWVSHLLQKDPAAVTLHGRTQKMQSDGTADWNEIGKARHVRDSLKSSTLILGNGDVTSYDQGLALIQKHRLDGVMIGRGIFHSPWIFNKNSDVHTTKDKLELLLRHINNFELFWGDRKNFHVLRRFFKIYAAGFHGALAIRSDLMTCSSPEEARNIVHSFRQKEGLLQLA